MAKILAIDPGNIASGWCLYDTETKEILKHAIKENDTFIWQLFGMDYDIMAIEMIASYGMSVGKTVFDTCVWIGRYIQANTREYCTVYRKDVKMFLCGTTRAKDGNIRQAIIDLFPATGGGKTPQIGTKKQKGPLYGVSRDVWAAIGVALTAENQLEQEAD